MMKKVRAPNPTCMPVKGLLVLATGAHVVGVSYEDDELVNWRLEVA